MSARTLREAIEALLPSWTEATCQADGAPCSWHRVSAECADEIRAVLAEYPDDQPEGGWPCDNYRSPLTCLTAPSSESARCDFCVAQAAAAQPEGETVTECPHLNVRTFRSVPPHSKCLDCGVVVEKRWTPVTPAGGEG